MFAVHTYPTKDLFLEDRKQLQLSQEKALSKDLNKNFTEENIQVANGSQKKVPNVILVNRKM